MSTATPTDWHSSAAPQTVQDWIARAAEVAAVLATDAAERDRAGATPYAEVQRLLRHLDDWLRAQGHEVIPLDVRTIPAEALLGADFRHPAIIEATELFDRVDGVVVGTPVYKASYSGVLKALLDLLPQYALTGKTVLPLATGGSIAHVLAIDYALRPVLSSMGASHIVQGWFTLDKDLTVHEDGSLTVTPTAGEALSQVVAQFSAALRRTTPVLTVAS